MDHLYYICLLMILTYRITATKADRGLNDYCNMETMNATCSDNEVIMLTHARYGRMSLGRCVKANYGFLGCSVDVMSYLDTLCSGRHNCMYKVPDEVLYDSHPCPGDFTSYLQLAYDCVPVETGNRAHCHSHQVLRVSGASTGYLASIITEKHNLGSVHCPWVIEAQPGQRINITLINFARTSELLSGGVGGAKEGGAKVDGYVGGAKQRLDICFELAVVSDAIDKKTVTICGGDARETVAYISKTNVAEVQIINRKMLKSIGMFLLKYEIIGCADPKLPHDVWSRRSGDKLVIQCNNTDQVWYLTCRHNKWVGDTGNCSNIRLSDQQPWALDDFFSTDEIFPYGILIVVAIGVALGVFFGGVLLAIILVYSRKRFRGPCAMQQHSAHELPLPGDRQFHTIHRGGTGSRWSLTDLQTYTEQDTLEKDMNSFRCHEHGQTIGTLVNQHVTGCGGGVGGMSMMIDVGPPPSSPAPASTATMSTMCTSSTTTSTVPQNAHGLDVIHGTRPPHTYESPFT